MAAIINVVAVLVIVSLVGVLRPFHFIAGSKRWHYGLAAFVLFIIVGVLGSIFTEPSEDATGRTEVISTHADPAEDPSPSNSPAPDRYSAKDLYWDEDTRPYQAQLLAAANRIVRENKQCVSINANGVTLSQNRGSPSSPVYFVTCESKNGPPFNVWFELDAAEKQDSFAATANIDQGTALLACQRAARSAAANPATVNFSTFMDVSFRKFPNGRSILRSTFTAQNAFGVEAEFDIECPFDGGALGSVTISEQRP